jgi:hypothetical protein
VPSRLDLVSGVCCGPCAHTVVIPVGGHGRIRRQRLDGRCVDSEETSKRLRATGVHARVRSWRATIEKSLKVLSLSAGEILQSKTEELLCLFVCLELKSIVRN